MKTIFDYYKSVWKAQHRYGKPEEEKREEKICKIPLQGSKILHGWKLWICSKLFDFIVFAGGISDMWYLHANVIGIIASISTNFILNKAWTFGDEISELKDNVTLW